MHRSVKHNQWTPLEEMCLSAIYIGVASLVLFLIIILVIGALPKSERVHPDKPTTHNTRPSRSTTTVKSTTTDFVGEPSARMIDVTIPKQFSKGDGPEPRAGFAGFPDAGWCDDICQDAMLTECDSTGAVVSSEISNRHSFAVAVLKQRYVDDSESFIFLCTGTVMHVRWFLTSGTCVDEPSVAVATQLRVRSGSDIWSAGGRLHRVLRLFYNSDRDGVSLGKVDPPFPSGSGVLLTPPKHFVLTQTDRLKSVGWNQKSTMYKFGHLNWFGVQIVQKSGVDLYGRHVDTTLCVGGAGFPLVHANLLIGVQADDTCDGITRRYYDITGIHAWILNIVRP